MLPGSVGGLCANIAEEIRANAKERPADCNGEDTLNADRVEIG